MSSKIKSLSIVMITFIVLLLTGCNNNAVSFEINFDSNGGSIVESVNYDGSSTVTIPDNPTKEGFIFDGWYWDNGTFENPFTANTLLDTPIKDDITLYAKWNINAYTLTFKDHDDTVLYEESYDYNTDLSELIVEDPSREGYTFNGWDSTIPLSMPENDVLIKATYTINQYTITFDNNEGTNVESITQDYDTAVSSPANPAKEGYDFGGWYTDEALTQAYTFSTMPAEDITLYAKWENRIQRLEAQIQDYIYHNFDEKNEYSSETNNLVKEIKSVLIDKLVISQTETQLNSVLNEAKYYVELFEKYDEYVKKGTQIITQYERDVLEKQLYIDMVLLPALQTNYPEYSYQSSVTLQQMIASTTNPTLRNRIQAAYGYRNAIDNLEKDIDNLYDNALKNLNQAELDYNNQKEELKIKYNIT